MFETALALCIALALVLTGMWIGQSAFYVMAGFVVMIGLADIIGLLRPGLARLITWAGRAGVIATALYLVFVLVSS